MSRTYRDYFLNPYRNWESIPWRYFGYSFAGTFGSVLIFPAFYVGLLMVGFMEDITDAEFERSQKISGAVHLSILFILLMAIPAIFIASAVVFFILGFYLDGYLLVGVSLLWITGNSVAMPALFYLLVKNGGWGWTKIWEIYTIGGLANDTYRRLSGVMFIANIILFIVGFSLTFTGIGIIMVPLLLLWYCYVCADVYSEMEQEFARYEESKKKTVEEIE